MWRFLCFGLLLLSCRERTVDMAVDLPLVVTPTRVDFGQVFAGRRSVRTVSLRNEGQVPRPVSFQLDPPFAASFNDTSVPRGETVELELSVSPLEPGVVTTTLSLDGTEVTLVVDARAVPTCVAPSACSTARFDLDTRACVFEPSPEGTACSTSCVTSGVCLQGECRGSAGTCDDGNVCTQDACAEDRGCVHLPLECAPPDDPCQAALCDAIAGCQKVAVEDGVRCGPDDCSRQQARVCINGACVTRARPQGELCFETVAGVAAGPGRVNARTTEARFFRVGAAATDRWGNTWVFEGATDAFVTRGGDVRRITPGGVVTTVIRSNDAQMQVDGVGVGQVTRPTAATTDVWGNAWILDGSNEGVCLRKVTPGGVLSTRSCHLIGQNRRYLEVLRDGRAFVAGPRAELLGRPYSGLELTELVADGGARLLQGEGPLAESERGNLLFFRALDAGLTQFEATPQGDVPVQRVQLSPDLYDVAAAGSAGQLLTARSRGAGCLLSVESDGGVSGIHSSPSRCWLTTLRWVGRDGEGYSFNESDIYSGTEVTRLTSSGGVSVAGLAEQPGNIDGFAATARLKVTAGLEFFYSVDSLFVRPDGLVLFSGEDSVRSVRTWSPATGVRTVGSGTFGMSVKMLQPTDGGFLVLQSNSFRFFDGSVLSPPILTARLENEAWLEPGVGGWVFDRATISRLGPDLSVRGSIVSTGFRDGPLPPEVDDGGLVQSDADAGTGAFRELHSPVELSPGTLALLDRNAVRTLSGSGLRTLAGHSLPGFVDGPALNARFKYPLSMNRAPNGDLYIADTENNAIRVLTATGQVRTVGRLTDRPAAVAVAPNGDVFVLVRHALLRGR